MNFLKYKLVYFLISLAVIIPGLVSLIRFGLKPSIDFTGGSLWEIAIANSSNLSEADLTQALHQEDLGVTRVQKAGQSFLIRAKPINDADHLRLKQKVQDTFGQVEEIRFETVGPTLGKELFIKTLTGVGLAAILILLYVAWRFKNIKFGLSAIIAMFHDSLILLGSFSLLGKFYSVEVDTLFVTAVLTILSFSVHDTIVVFDRIRETSRVHPKAKLERVINKSIAETLGRSVNNSMTIIFMLLALFLLGGETIKHFVLALLIGTIAGTYSSTFTAAPLLEVFENLKKPD